jgi:hypothetical protein
MKTDKGERDPAGLAAYSRATEDRDWTVIAAARALLAGRAMMQMTAEIEVTVRGRMKFVPDMYFESESDLDFKAFAKKYEGQECVITALPCAPQPETSEREGEDAESFLVMRCLRRAERSFTVRFSDGAARTLDLKHLVALGAKQFP